MRAMNKTSMNKTTIIGILLWATVIAVVAQAAKAQETPTEYQEVLKIVGKTGDYKSNVLKINIPRNDLHVKVAGYSLPTPFGVGGWFAMTKGDGGEEVVMGDLVLTQDEVNPVMSSLLEHGFEVTALHNHFFWEEPRVFFMHIHGHGKAGELANQIKPAIDLIGYAKPTESGSPKPATEKQGALDTDRIARSEEHTSELQSPVHLVCRLLLEKKKSELNYI